MCVKKGHKVWCIFCASMINAAYDCSRCQVDVRKYSVDHPHQIDIRRRELGREYENLKRLIENARRGKLDGTSK